MRNRLLNLLIRLLFLRHLLKLFRGSAVFGVIFVGIVGFIGFSIFSPYFEIKRISIIRDNPNIDAKQIEEALQDFYGRNLIFLSQKEIQEELTKLFPEFQKVKVIERWPAAIELKIQTSPPLLTILNQETANFFVISKNGVVLSEKPDENLPIIKVFGYEKLIFPHQQFTTSEVLEKVLTAKNLFEQEFELPLKDVHLYVTAKEIHLISKHDVAIWIDLQQPIEKQMKKLELAANRIGLYDDTALDHIDLRVANQIFWAQKGQ